MTYIYKIIIYLFSFFLAYVLTTFIHEIGHAIMVILGGGSFRIVLGASKFDNGRLLMNTKYLVIYTSFYLGGFCDYHFNKSVDEFSTIYLILLNLGGFLAQFIFSYFLYINKKHMSPMFLYRFYRPMQITNIISAFLSLLPINKNEKGYNSDGTNIINILKNK